MKIILCNEFLTKLIASFMKERTVILMYHDLRVDEDFDNWMRVSVSNFTYQLKRLQQIGDFIGPDDLFCQAASKRLRFLVTFDDGYLNNFELAAPILQQYEVPALFFVSTWHMENQKPFWSDIVVTPVQALGLERLDLCSFDMGVFKFRPVGSARRWGDIQRLLVAIKNLGNVSHPTVVAVLQYLQSQYADTLAEHLPRFRPINTNEVKLMSTNPLFSFGSHSHHHDILTYQDNEDVDTNLLISKHNLEEIIGCTVTHLAYPNGANDIRIRERTEKAGYSHAYSVKAGVVADKTPMMSLPRLGVSGVGQRSLLFFQLNRLLVGGLLK